MLLGVVPPPAQVFPAGRLETKGAVGKFDVFLDGQIWGVSSLCCCQARQRGGGNGKVSSLIAVIFNRVAVACAALLRSFAAFYSALTGTSQLAVTGCAGD